MESQGCKRARFGWWCSRTPGHTGACAARPKWWNLGGRYCYRRPHWPFRW
ncbi:hypothetical protein C7458_102756 [Williamsia muralis]|nr:hypothetical protein C7458_102756 [Williamsia marianensis]